MRDSIRGISEFCTWRLYHGSSTGIRDAAKPDIRYAEGGSLFFDSMDLLNALSGFYSFFVTALPTNHQSEPTTSVGISSNLGIVLRKGAVYPSDSVFPTGVWLVEAASSVFQDRYMKMHGLQWFIS